MKQTARIPAILMMVYLVMGMLLAGCQTPATPVSVPTPQPTATAIPTATPQPTSTPTPIPEPTSTSTLVPTETPTPEPTIGLFTDNVYYTNKTNSRQTLAVYLPDNSQPPYRTVIVFHAGGFVEGHRSEVIPVAEYLNRKGIAAITAAYRLQTYPKPVNDAFCVLAWTFAEAERYGFDTNHIVTMGFSAGAELASLLGLITERDAYLEDCPHTLPDEVSVAGIVGYSGDYDELNTDDVHPDALEATQRYLQYGTSQFEELAIAASPMTYVHSGAPPFLLFHSPNDYIIDISSSRDFLAALQAAGVEANLIEISETDHIDLAGWRTDASDESYRQTMPKIQMDKAADFIKSLE